MNIQRTINLTLSGYLDLGSDSKSQHAFNFSLKHFSSESICTEIIVQKVIVQKVIVRN